VCGSGITEDGYLASAMAITPFQINEYCSRPGNVEVHQDFERSTQWMVSEALRTLPGGSIMSSADKRLHALLKQHKN